MTGVVVLDLDTGYSGYRFHWLWISLGGMTVRVTLMRPLFDYILVALDIHVAGIVTCLWPSQLFAQRWSLSRSYLSYLIYPLASKANSCIRFPLGLMCDEHLKPQYTKSRSRGSLNKGFKVAEFLGCCKAPNVRFDDVCLPGQFGNDHHLIHIQGWTIGFWV